jgi:hypothetical protein
MPRQDHVPTPNAGTIVARPINVIVSSFTHAILSLSTNVILSLSKDEHQQHHEIARCPT